jgi:aminopeptidase N
VPKGYDVVANGIPQESTSHADMQSFHFTTREPMASYLTMIAIGHYDRELLKTESAIPIYNYYYKGMEEKDKEVFKHQADMLTFFSEIFGAYPFASAGIVASKGESILAYETQTRPFFGTPASEQMLAHEIAHQWFGNMVSLDEWKESWLKEGFATYAAALWFEHQQGPEAMKRWVKGTFESLMGIQKLPKENLSRMFKAFEIKERKLNKEEVKRLIALGTKGKTDKTALKKALAHVPKEGLSNYKVEVAFKEMDFPYFDLTFNQYAIFMNTLSGKPTDNTISFEDLVANLGEAPRAVNSMEQIYSSGVYARGALAIHALRTKVGDATFFKILQSYFKRYKNSHANSVDFENIAKEISGKNLDNFFHAWLEGKMIPDIPEYGLYKKDYAK